ncbi:MULTISPECIES: hypothetical protein [Acetobacteraceae]|nr:MULTISPECIES: hypothetical protein [Acetobacteraceae]
MGEFSLKMGLCALFMPVVGEPFCLAGGMIQPESTSSSCFMGM